MIVFDVIVDGNTITTLRPQTTRLKDLRLYLNAEAKQLIEKYGHNVYLNRRFEY